MINTGLISKNFIACIFAASLLCAGCEKEENVTAPPPEDIQVSYGDYELVWSEEFDYEGLPAENTWVYEEGYMRNNEKQDYKVANTKYSRVENGKLIIEAHRMLEKYTLSKWQQYWKDQVANWYGMFLHESQYLEPVMPDIEAMLTSSQRNVNGTAVLKLRPLGFECVGIDSPDDLLKSKLGEYGEMQHGWTAEEAKGFIKVLSTPLRVYYGIHEDEER